MRTTFLILLFLGLATFLTGCESAIELVGYGGEVNAQHGLKVKLLSSDRSTAAEIHVTNQSENIVSINQSFLAMEIHLTQNGQDVTPESVMKHKLSINPSPDEFVILAPGQTRIIPVPVFFKNDICRTFHHVYKLEKGNLYDIEVILHPYFRALTEENIDDTLSTYKIPNYLETHLLMNTMQIRLKPLFE